MKSKAVIPRERAHLDTLNAVAHYRGEGSPQAAAAFIAALEKAYNHLGSNPASGSPRYAHELNLPGLRVWPLQGFPWLIFYVERTRYVEVWRLLHMGRDIPRGWGDAGPD